MTDIKLYVACHRPVKLPQHPYLYPVHAGAKLSGSYFNNMQRDDNGEHISDKNCTYCELTVQYWAWKNQKAEYYGFFHYRRFMSFQIVKKTICDIYLQPNDSVLMDNGYDIEYLSRFVSAYDVLVPCAEKTVETVYQKYINAPYHYKEDIDLMMMIVAQHQPKYRDAMEQYMQGHDQYYFNMYVMKQEWFDQYCQWLFPLLKQFDYVNNWNKYNENSIAMRVDGYLAERLFGVWYTYQMQHNTLRSIEVPWFYFAMGDKKLYKKQWLKNKLLPPGSRRKRIIKRLQNRGRQQF